MSKTINDYEFSCPENLAEIFKESFDLSNIEKLKEEAEAFICEYEGREKGVRCIERKDFMPRTDDKNFLQIFNDSRNVIGVDFPTLLKNRNRSNGKLIMIVAQDPLRNPKDKSEKIILSTPFGLQLKKFRINKDNTPKPLWGFTTFLLNKGYSVYYTDIRKIWIEGKPKFPKDLNANFRKTLYNEITNTYKPTIILTFGKMAEKALDNYSESMGTVPKKLNLLHPSGANGAAWKKVINGMETKFGYLCKKFEEFSLKNNF